MTQERINPLPEMQEKQGTRDVKEKPDNNLTISTKLSTEQLICKTPQESPNASVKSVKNEEIAEKQNIMKESDPFSSLLYLGMSQILFGLLMAVFGVLVIIHNAKLAQLGGGIWGGCLAVGSGTTGVLAAAKNWCPLKSSAQRVAHTVFLALSLISVAVSQLVLVLAATGLARDINTDFNEETDWISNAPKSKEVFGNLPPNYMALLSNAVLLIVSGIECVCAALSTYRSSRALCPCFRDHNEGSKRDLHANAKDAFVNSWLGKHSLQSPLYVITAPTGTGKRSRLSSNLTIAPMHPLPRPVLASPSLMGYPLIPAPLGPVPSPIIRLPPKEMLHRKHKRCRSVDHHKQKLDVPMEKPKKTKSKSITTEEVVRTYTGLDRAIAEEFIEICDSRNNSLCCDSSCRNSSQTSECTGSQTECTACANNTNSDFITQNKKL